MKKFSSFGILITCLLVLSACPSPKKTDALKKLKENNYDFSSIRRSYHQGLFFYIPTYFHRDYSSYYLAKDDGVSYSNSEAGIYFSVEKFTQSEAEDFQFSYEDNTSELRALHDYYCEKRINSLYEPKVSIVSDNPKKAALNGIYQSIEGPQYEYSSPMVYFFTTVKKNVGGQDYYFVVQLVCPKDLSKYLTDDFRRLIKRLK